METFSDQIKYGNDSGLSIYGHISTKGILFTENKIEIISATGTDFLRICIDMLRPHVYKKIGNSHQQYVITNNIKMVLDEAPTLKVQLQLKRTKLNEDETARDYFAMFGKQQNGSVFYARYGSEKEPISFLCPMKRLPLVYATNLIMNIAL